MKTSISTAKHTFTYDLNIFGLTKKKVGWSLFIVERQTLEVKEMLINSLLNGFDNVICKNACFFMLTRHGLEGGIPQVARM